MNKVKVQKYLAYKDSGVEWLGEIPEGWKVKRLKYVLKERSERSSTGEEPLLMMSQVYGLVVRSEYHDKAEVATSSVDNKLVQQGDLVFNKLKAHLGVFFKSTIEFKGLVSPDYAVYYSNGVIQDVKYLEFLFRTPKYIGQFIVRATGVAEGLIRLYTGDLFEIAIPIPPHTEQSKIVNFLDDKTTKIDQAIAQKEQLIALLKERKQIIIQNAVTKGLDPNVKMKDSGVEWIGEIPEHWEVKRLKYLLKEPLKYGANESGIEYHPDLPRYIRITDFSGAGKLNEEKKLSLPFEIGKEYLLEDGDILFARSGATVGKSYQFRKSFSIEKDYCFAGYLIKASPNQSLILSDYLNYYTASGSFENWKSLIFNKATIENIGADKYSQLVVPYPSTCEQREINEYIEDKSFKIDQIIVLQQTQIEKLKEYKATLIDSAVTGKIKVV